MENKNNKQQDLEDSFRDRFEDFEVPRMKPEGENKEDLDFDQLFQSQFDELEQTPDKKIWENVQKELPLHLIWRKRLNQLSRIAAVLLIGLFLSMMIAQQSDAIKAMVFKGNTSPVEAPAPVVKASDFVFDANNEQGDIDQQENSKALFEDYAPQNNQEELALENQTGSPSLLEPLPSLPIQTVEVTETDLESYAEDNNNSSMQISIPLRVVNANEIDGLIDQYEADIMARQGMVNPAQ